MYTLIDAMIKTNRYKRIGNILDLKDVLELVGDRSRLKEEDQAWPDGPHRESLYLRLQTCRKSIGRFSIRMEKQKSKCGN